MNESLSVLVKRSWERRETSSPANRGAQNPTACKKSMREFYASRAWHCVGGASWVWGESRARLFTIFMNESWKIRRVLVLSSGLTPLRAHHTSFNDVIRLLARDTRIIHETEKKLLLVYAVSRGLSSIVLVIIFKYFIEILLLCILNI